jgi:PAS domain S-box-containing protein
LILKPNEFLRRFKPIREARRRRAPGYVAAAVGVAAMVLLRVLFADLLEPVTFTLFYPVIALAALVGGARAGSLALGLAALSAHLLFMEPRFNFDFGAALVPTGVFLAAGAILVALVSLLNVAVDRISQEAATTKRILEDQPVGLVLVDAQGIINFVNSQIERDTGYDRDELRGEAMEILVPNGRRAVHADAVHHYMDHPRCRHAGAGGPLEMQRKNGSLVPVEIGLTPFEAFGFVGALATVVDISERKEIERRELIASEVRHRARNVLTLVQALARRTLPEHDRGPFVGMLQSIARTQDVLNAQSWMPLRTIIDGELNGFAHCVSDAGCELNLTARAAQDFALILHELTTNAVKYGALSQPDGHVEITCRREADGRSCTFLWKERGGPEVAPPQRRGFGSTIMQDLARGFATDVEIDYDPEGFRYELHVEMARICQAVEHARPALAASVSTGGDGSPERP